MHLRLFIPTRGRVQSQRTWDCLPKQIQSRTVLICPRAEAKEHIQLGRNVIVSPVEGIAPKRQWIFDEFNRTERYLLMLDDDLVFFRRIDGTSWKLRVATHNDLIEMFNRIEQLLLSGYIQVGVSPRAGNNRFFPNNIVECTRITNIHGYDTKGVRDLGVHFFDPMMPTTFTMEDFHCTLSLLYRGGRNCLLTDFAWDQSTSNFSGGCSIYRDSETQKVSAELLAKRHPGFVKVVQKTTKTSWKGVQSSTGSRTDVVVYWRKAYEAGRLKRGEV